MQGKSIAECSHGAFCSTLTCIKLPHGLKTLVLSIFEWPLKTGFTVQALKKLDESKGLLEPACKCNKSPNLMYWLMHVCHFATYMLGCAARAWMAASCSL